MNNYNFNYKNRPRKTNEEKRKRLSITHARYSTLKANEGKKRSQHGGGVMCGAFINMFMVCLLLCLLTTLEALKPFVPLRRAACDNNTLAFFTGMLSSRGGQCLHQ
jgi:hypothetical protein